MLCNNLSWVLQIYKYMEHIPLFTQQEVFEY
jgi:hypothetical protein